MSAHCTMHMMHGVLKMLLEVPLTLQIAAPPCQICSHIYSWNLYSSLWQKTKNSHVRQWR